jgi:predicted nucleic-acid-binding Zn-ribbon protein
MPCRCPQCGYLELVEQDIEVLSDSALLVKTSNRMQLRCQQCGWMAYGELTVSDRHGNCEQTCPQGPIGGIQGV